MMAGSRNARVASLRWTLLAAIGGLQFAASCGGKMTHNPAADDSAGQPGATTSGGATPLGQGGSQAAGGNEYPCTSVSRFSSNLMTCNDSFVHRPTAVSCALPAHDESVMPGQLAGGATTRGSTRSVTPCQEDGDCPPGGYCVEEMAGGVCVFACQNDGECDPNEVCACDSYLRQRDATPIELGFCTPADCRSDGDCASGFLCTVPLDSALGCPSGPSKFTCQNASDECAGTKGCPVGTVCSSSSPHRCVPGAACGRPFLVDGDARRATQVTSASWLDETLSRPPSQALDAKTSRARLP